jgi:predicted site-specific integrase-resolvase
VVEYRDRLARFGVEHLGIPLAATGRRIVVLALGEVTEGLVGDSPTGGTQLQDVLRVRRSESQTAPQ